MSKAPPPDASGRASPTRSGELASDASTPPASSPASPSSTGDASPAPGANTSRASSRTTATGKALQAQVAERRRLVRRLLAEGMSRAEVVALLVKGAVIERGKAGEAIKMIMCSETTAKNDVRAVAEEYKGLFSDEDHAAVEIGTSIDRIRKLAAGGRSEHVRLLANKMIIELAAGGAPQFKTLLSARRAGAEDLDTPEVPRAEGDELERLELEELKRVHAQKRLRVDAMGLTVVPGGKQGSG